MKFIPAGERIGEQHQVRTVGLAASPDLPDGEYTFVDCYCTDPECDCRRVIILVLHNGKHVSTINYGWESSAFYKKWYGGKTVSSIIEEMKGSSIDIASPNRVKGPAMLAFFNRLLTDDYVNVLKKHYMKFKRAIKNDPPPYDD
ncbi:MAG: hypothetical protein HW390_1232 [Candidatus Brocadiaceae bacterium]|nr:hypothetical protein [Candidatus Brocadiaceae bacterium]